MIVVIPLLVFITFALLAYALIPPRSDVIAQRLRPYQYGLERGERSDLEKPFSERILWPIVATIARFVMRASPQQVHDQVTAELEKAGNPVRPATFLFMRFVCLIVLPAIYALPIYLSHRPTTLLQVCIVILLFFLGYRLPLTWLRLKIDAKKTAIDKALPDALDLITVCMEAGLAFDASLAKVVQKTRGPLSVEFGRVLQEMGLGKLRRDALRDLGQRNGVPDLRSFVAALVQADQMGMSIADILRVQADELRVRRRQRAEEKAMKAPVKLLFPLLLCIFPAMMVVLLGPAVWAIYTNIIGRMHV